MAVSPGKHDIGQMIKKSGTDPKESAAAPYSPQRIKQEMDSPIDTVFKRIVHTLRQIAAAIQERTTQLATAPETVISSVWKKLRRSSSAGHTSGQGEESTLAKQKVELLKWLQKFGQDLDNMSEQLKENIGEARQRFNQSVKILVETHAPKLAETLKEFAGKQLTLAKEHPDSFDPDMLALHQKIHDCWPQLEADMVQPNRMQELYAALRNHQEALLEQQETLDDNNVPVMSENEVCEVCVEHILQSPTVRPEYAKLQPQSQREAVEGYRTQLRADQPNFFKSMRNAAAQYAREQCKTLAAERALQELSQASKDVSANNSNESKLEQEVDTLQTLHRGLTQLRMQMGASAVKPHDEELEYKSSSPSPFKMTPGGR